MHLLVLEFVALYIRGVQLVSLIVLSICSPNQCFVNKVDELNESVPMDVDKVVMIKARDDMEIENNLWRLTMICRILWRSTTILWRLTRICMENKVYKWMWTGSTYLFGMNVWNSSWIPFNPRVLALCFSYVF
jgi:hypothetical protein